SNQRAHGHVLSSKTTRRPNDAYISRKIISYPAKFRAAPRLVIKRIKTTHGWAPQVQAATKGDAVRLIDGDRPSQMCLPRLRAGGGAVASTGAQGRAADRGHVGYVLVAKYAWHLALSRRAQMQLAQGHRHQARCCVLGGLHSRLAEARAVAGGARPDGCSGRDRACGRRRTAAKKSTTPRFAIG